MIGTEAGKGGYHVYRILPKNPSDDEALKPGKHYLSIDAVAWFINKDDSWWSNRMASGTLDISLSSDLEKYQAALGTFELKGGARVAPVFEQPVLPQRNFVGGPINLDAFLTAIKKDTVLAGILKSAANASLGIVAGMVQTASVTGPATLLSAAGGQLISGVKNVLETGEKHECFFDSFSGIKYAVLHPEELKGSAVFLLFHRGSELSESALTLGTLGQLVVPFLNGSLLEDGAWLLLRLSRSDHYSGVRDWYASATALRGNIASLVMDVEQDARTKEEALKRLKPGSTGDSTYWDEFVKLRTVILNDAVLSENERRLNVGELAGIIAAAKKAIMEHDGAVLVKLTTGLQEALVSGSPISGPVGQAFTEHAGASPTSILSTAVKGTPSMKRHATFSDFKNVAVAARADTKAPFGSPLTLGKRAHV